MNGAACTGMDTELFFSDKAADIQRARLACRRCPARIRCLMEAAVTGDRYGIRAGLTGTERLPLGPDLTGQQAGAALRAYDKTRAAGQSARVAVAEMRNVIEAIARCDPGWVEPDPDAAEHVRVLLRELDAYEAAHRRPRPVSRPAPAEMNGLKDGRNEAIRLRRAGLPVPETVAELERGFWRVYRQSRRKEAANAA